MKGLRFPLWLICDAAAALRLALATCMLAFQVRRHWPKHSAKPPSREGIATITALLSIAEALVVLLPEAGSSLIWQARCRTFVRLIENMSLYARCWATRMRARDKDVRIPDPSNPTIFQNPNPSNPAPSNFRTPNSVAIRGPPQVACYPRMHVTRALLIAQRGRGRLCVCFNWRTRPTR